MKITKRQLKRIIREESQRCLNEAFDHSQVDVGQDPRARAKGTSFSLTDETGSVDVQGDLLNADDVINLAETIERLYAGQIQPEGAVSFTID
mgnify:CR=1 FL=1